MCHKTSSEPCHMRGSPTRTCATASDLQTSYFRLITTHTGEPNIRINEKSLMRYPTYTNYLLILPEGIQPVDLAVQSPSWKHIPEGSSPPEKEKDENRPQGLLRLAQIKVNPPLSGHPRKLKKVSVSRAVHLRELFP